MCNGKNPVKIIEVGPRDGFQNVQTHIPAADKLEIIDRLYQSGIRSMEVTSFVSPKAIPQMADAGEVARAVLAKYPDLQAIALVPNLRGAQNAWDAGIREISYVISASEAHNKTNVNRTIAESVAGLAAIQEALPELTVHLDVATAFGCPFSGKTPVEDVLRLVGEVAGLGICEVTLCDTIGVANPVQVQELLQAVCQAFPEVQIALHFHNTRGMGLANMFAACRQGIRSFETAIGGLGGCPFAPGADGNTATEDAVHMLQEMGMDTGIDLDLLLRAAKLVSEKVDAKLTGKLLFVTESTCSMVSGKANG